MDMSKSNYGILHCHSEFSVKDSAMSIQSMFERAKALGAPALALTDHGILIGFYDFIKLAGEYGIKPIPGIEAYFVPDAKKDSKPKGTKQHLILMAKDIIGYYAICDAVRRSYANEIEDYPRMDFDILQRCFGPGAKGHQHVYATSACMSGPLAQIILERHITEKETEGLRRKRDKYHPVDDELLNAIHKEEELIEEINTLMAQRTALEEASKVNLNGLKRSLRALPAESEEAVALAKDIEAKATQKERAKTALSDIKKRIAAKRKAKSEYSKSISSLKASAERWVYIDDQINAIKNAVQPENVLYAAAKKSAQRFAAIFGEGNFFIELQNHHIEQEIYAMPRLAQLAKELGLPVVAANDVHYATNSASDIRARTLISAMRFNTVIDEANVALEEGYGELYMKSDGELQEALSEILDPDIVAEAMENIGVIVQNCDVQIVREDHYPVFIGGIPGETPDQRLRRLATEGIPHRYPGKEWTKEKEDRMNYELDVISSLGYSSYLCIVQDFLAYGRSLSEELPGGVGYMIGPGRGSAVGSIVCYLSGITSVDPIKYGLLFERFLNRDRVSMPDIDSDFHTEIRSKVIDYVKSKYGERAVCNIATKTAMAGRSAIRGVGRVTDIPESIVDMVARMIPSTPNAKIDDASDLDRLCNSNPIAKKLVEDARLIEGTTVSYGMHAAGVIIADNSDVGKYVPLMYNREKEQWVAQCDMGQCESDAGLLKMDFLGLKNLDIITDTLQRIYRNRGIAVDMESVPFEPEVCNEIFAKGRTISVFQFESTGMQSMLKKFRPTTMEDLILLVAAYRPGPLKYIPDITAVKNGAKTPSYIADGLKEILDVTYGRTIYQEQVMQIFNKVAGFSLGESDIIRRAMSKKKLAILTDPKTDYHGKFIRGLIAHGATEEDAEQFWGDLLDFASYAFNKSHAAAYAFVAYYTAYLKYHYPAEYMCSVMTRAPFKKLPELISECKEMGLKISPPDINSSVNEFINISSTILFGFGNIKGIGSAGQEVVELRQSGQFISLKDFVYRFISSPQGGFKSSVVSTLIEAGAFDGFCEGNRQSLLHDLDSFISITKKMQDAQLKREQLLAQKEALEQSGASETELKKITRSENTVAKKLAGFREAYALHNFLMVPEDPHAKLAKEHELLGFYISGNPVDEYADAIKLVPKAVAISAVEADCEVVICGMVSDLRVLQRKSDGRHFCSFTLFDSTGLIEVKCFTKEYPKFKALIQEGAPLTITGKSRLQDNYSDPEADPEIVVTVVSVQALARPKQERIIISGSSILDWQQNYNLIASYEQPDGYECYYSDQTELTMRRCEFRVSKDILNMNADALLVSVMPLV